MSTRQTTDDTRIESSRVGPDDPRYLAVVDKRFNKQFSARPDYVRLVRRWDPQDVFRHALSIRVG